MDTIWTPNKTKVISQLANPFI